MAHTLSDAGFTPTQKYKPQTSKGFQIHQKPAFDNGKSGAETQ